MKKYICFLLFVLLYLISCTSGAGECQDCFVAEDDEIKEVIVQSEDEMVSLCFKNKSAFAITIYKDSLREKAVCNIDSEKSAVITREKFSTDIVYYVTYNIRLSNDFVIPYYANESFIIVPSREKSFQNIVIASPASLKIQSSYVILENESNQEIIFKYGASELIFLDSIGGFTNKSSVILPYESGLYKINPVNFDDISSYCITTVSGSICNLEEKLISFKPGTVYKIIIKNTSRGKAECSLKSVSYFNSSTTVTEGLTEITDVNLTYITGSSTKVTARKIPIGLSLSSIELPDLKRSGYNFTGWYYYNKKIIPGYIALDDVTLYGQWKLIYYTADNLNQMELSNLENEYTINVNGIITASDLDIIASKIKKANKNITLNLRGATGLSEICSGGISSSRFSNCNYLKSIILPESLEKVGNYAFTYCYYLDCVEISEGTTSLGYYPFYKCTNLTSVTIPKSMKSLGYAPFSYCSKLSTINYRGTKAQWNSISKNGWRENAYNSITQVVCSDGVIKL